MKKAKFRINRVNNGFILSNETGTYISKDVKDLTTLLGDYFISLIPKENETTVDLEITIND